MSTKLFQPSIWADELLLNLSQQATSSAATNNNYQGKPMYGGKVIINTINDISVKQYDKEKNIVYDNLDTYSLDLNIDDKKYWAIKINNIDEVQIKNKKELMNLITKEASLQVANALDVVNFQKLYDESLVKLVHDINDNATAKEAILGMKKLADRINVPKQGRVLFVSSEIENYLWDDVNINVNTHRISKINNKRGYVGRIYGIDVYVSSALPKDSAGNEIMILTHPLFMTEVIELNKIDAMSSEEDFADLLKGLIISGRAVTHPQGVIVLSSSEVEPSDIDKLLEEDNKKVIEMMNGVNISSHNFKVLTDEQEQEVQKELGTILNSLSSYL